MADSELTTALDKLVTALEKNTRSQGGPGGLGVGAGGSSQAAAAATRSFFDRAKDQTQAVAAGRAFGGGFAGLAAQGAFGLGAAGIGAAGAVAGAGALSALDGRTFSGGASRGLIGLAASIPGVSQITGAGRTAEAFRGAEGDLNAITNELVRHGVQLSQQDRAFFGNQVLEENKRIVQDRRLNEGFFEGKAREVVKGAGSELEKKIEEMTEALRSLPQAIAQAIRSALGVRA